MIPTYDLGTAPWIPVHFRDGSDGAVGLRDALVRAHEIREIALDNPMETCALYRLLLALAVRIFPKTEEPDDWFEYWDAARFDPTPIDAYFTQWSDRFDLFHPVRPFGQVRSNVGNGTLEVGLLRLDECGNTSWLFSHLDLKKTATLPPDEAARGLVASQHAAIGGLLSNPYKAGNRNSPAVGGAIFWMLGASLYHSLLLNAPPDPHVRMGGHSDADAPSWEQEEPSTPERRPHHGFLDYLTFQHRRITLETGERDGHTVVTAILRTGGNAEEPMPLDDPHMAIINGDEKSEPRRYNVQTGRAVWRDAAVFLTLVSKRGTPPRTFVWATSHLDDLGIERLDVEVFALRTRGANDGTIKLWRRERIPLFLNVLADNSRGAKLELALERADEQARNLAWATLIAAARLRVPGKNYGELSSMEKEDAKKLARSIDTEGRYWSGLESYFFQLLHDLAHGADPNSDPDWSTAPINEWTRRIYRTALGAYDAATRSLDANARQLHAVAEGRAAIRATARFTSKSATSDDTSTNVVMEESV
ncbi:MAG TPA: type I-E CRISPR-associated protein Cse1/CasA [Candidatus Kapabacteria bacterium]|nr:type I-E CRISPR-associated protein Cse1/CasA [Candidatus Kapabacteria bacterium]